MEPPRHDTGTAAIVVAPTYNNADTLLDILERIDATGFSVIVVNDGSSDGTPEILASWERQHRPPAFFRVDHERNRGKAVALRTGFERAIELGFTHAVTIDTDGQLDPEQIPELVAVAGAEPHALIIGARDYTRPDYPARSRLGRRISNHAIRVASGETVVDSQCGFRVYPLEVTQLRCRARHFGWEAEIITRAVWAGYRIVNVPVRCRYFPDEGRVSHLNPWRETVRGILLHTRLILTRLLLPVRMRCRRTVAPRSAHPAAPAEAPDREDAR